MVLPGNDWQWNKDANIVQAEHHCLQVYSWASSILSDEFMCPSRYRYKSLLPSLSNTWKPAGAQDENGDLWTTEFCCFWSYYLEHFAIDPTCIDHYTRTVSEWTKDNTVLLGLLDMTRRFRDCLGRWISAL